MGATMTNSELKTWLVERNACEPALAWLGDRDLATAWAECESPGWMLWLCDHGGISDATMRMLACRFVRETPMGDGRMVWDLLTDERSRTAVEVAERYAKGEATAEELRSAWAWANAAANAAAGAAWAAEAAARAADAAAWADAAADAAATAAARAAWAAEAAERAAAEAADAAAAASSAWAEAAAGAALAAAWASAAYEAAAADGLAAAARLAQCRIIREMISLHDIESAMEAK
jgi:hypothetical protein